MLLIPRFTVGWAFLLIIYFQAKKFITALQKRAELQTKSVFSVTEMKEVAALAKIQIGDFYTFVSNLNTQGFLIKKGKHMYQLLSVDY